MILAPLLLAATVSVGHSEGCAQDPTSRHVTTVQRLSESLHLIHRYGGNQVVFTGKEGVLMVGAGFLDGAHEVELSLAKLTSAPLRYLINTHWHKDHSGANAYWGLAGATVIAHENARLRMLGGDGSEGTKKLFHDPPMDPEGLPTVTFRERLELTFNGEPVLIEHHPLGHTDGDAVVYFPEQNVVVMGDLYRQDNFPYIELRSGARPAGMLRAVEAVLRRVPADVTVVPGHGKVGTRADLREFYDMLWDANEQVKRAVARGQDLIALYNNKLLGEYEDRWAGGGQRNRVRGFLQIMWYCYAPKSARGLGEKRDPATKPQF
ncbi:MAG: MBL fold metallo-hydrolase [Planctomycetota bacterium]|jgi:glyoxylase-like metal-dependent hydrolase (beta-lactamase superfamily II)|nr:MBL fold metallo-hydrolase [Planctomycetota bacterium]MDP6990933.1 MBL fold metallo-hydrolase [Planctomycetota bacterium]